MLGSASELHQGQRRLLAVAGQGHWGRWEGCRWLPLSPLSLFHPPALHVFLLLTSASQYHLSQFSSISFSFFLTSGISPCILPKPNPIQPLALFSQYLPSAPTAPPEQTLSQRGGLKLSVKPLGDTPWEQQLGNRNKISPGI